MPSNQASGSGGSWGAADIRWLGSLIMDSGTGRMPVSARELKLCRNPRWRAVSKLKPRQGASPRSAPEAPPYYRTAADALRFNPRTVAVAVAQLTAPAINRLLGGC